MIVEQAQVHFSALVLADGFCDAEKVMAGEQ